MAITLNDFKEGGSLREYVTKIGLLDKINDSNFDQEELLDTLTDSITVTGRLEFVENLNDSVDQEENNESQEPQNTINPLFSPPKSNSIEVSEPEEDEDLEENKDLEDEDLEDEELEDESPSVDDEDNE